MSNSGGSSGSGSTCFPIGQTDRCYIWLADTIVCYSSIPAPSASDFRFCVIPRLLSLVLLIAPDLSKHWPSITAEVRREAFHCSVPGPLLRFQFFRFCFAVCAQGRGLTTLVSLLFSYSPPANVNASCQKAPWWTVRLETVSLTSQVKDKL